jgi:hypothetical protein
MKKDMPMNKAMKKWEGSPADKKLDKAGGKGYEGSKADKKIDKAAAKKVAKHDPKMRASDHPDFLKYIMGK